MAKAYCNENIVKTYWRKWPMKWPKRSNENETIIIVTAIIIIDSNIDIIMSRKMTTQYWYY